MFDGGGLHLVVTPSGGKLWRVAYRFEGKARTFSIGPYPEVSLAEARGRLAEMKKVLHSGVDPMAEKRRAKALHSGMVLREAVSAYWEGRQDLSPSYREGAMRGITLHLAPLMEMPIANIGRGDVLACLQRLNARGTFVFVRKVHMWARQVFDWAVEHGHAEANPAASIRSERAFGKRRVKHIPSLALKELPEFLRRLSFEEEYDSVLACKLLALTWVRTGELRLMEWSEIDGNLWIIPEGKMKRTLDHVVPLSRQALDILAKMRLRGTGRYVFSSYTQGDRPISHSTILTLIGSIGYKGRMTGHGWRSVASTWANERGYNADAIERQLAHVQTNKVRDAYNRALYLPLRREMLQAWADWLDEITPGDG
jgi:integrase